MNYLIVARHGDNFGHLTELGIQQMSVLAEMLRPLAVGQKVVLVSSQEKRARESADIIGKVLDCKPQANGALNPTPWDFTDYAKHYFDEGAEVLIVVCHQETTRDLPHKFARQFLALSVPEVFLSEGEACVIDCQGKRWYHITN